MKTRFRLRQIVSFTRNHRILTGAVKEITLFRRSETIGLLVNTNRGTYWIGEEEVIKPQRRSNMANIGH